MKKVLATLVPVLTGAPFISKRPTSYVLCLLMATLLIAGPTMAYSTTMMAKYQEQGSAPLLPVEEEEAHHASTFLHPSWCCSLFAMAEADEHSIIFDERLTALLHGEVDVPPPKA